MSSSKHTNLLIHESSPYLLQHAHNPVNWHAWNDDTLEKASRENKLLLISIGYSACHWCHVMEEESFTDEVVAELMNEHFLCIKVDREERPDVDQVYMDAVQMISGRGGWPLNCFALPDGRPFYGGTYFSREQWVSLLENIILINETRHEELEKQATELTEGIKSRNIISAEVKASEHTSDDLEQMLNVLETSFDYQEGGSVHVPKFPMPGNYLFLLRLYYRNKNKALLQHIELTLEKMAFGGLYDQVGGGFARYSTDRFWKVPHFEKMLYDNAQLVSLYSEAYRITGKEFYKEVVIQTLEFIEEEMTHPEGGFYSALDADSEGEEGKYYVWTSSEIDEVLGLDASIFRQYFNIDAEALWENENNILLRKQAVKDFAINKKLDPKVLISTIKSSLNKLKEHRKKRVKPGLDDKILTSWNALMLKAYIDAYIAFDEEHFLEAALKNAEFLKEKLFSKDGVLFHTWKNSKASIAAFLDDYAFLALAFIDLYQLSFNMEWLKSAQKLIEKAIDHFKTDDSPLLYYSSEKDHQLISRKSEIYDNVIPSSNAAMALAFFKLGHLNLDQALIERSERMLQIVKEDMLKFPGSFAAWGKLLLHLTTEFNTIAISGQDAGQRLNELSKFYLPDTVFTGSKIESDAANLAGRYTEGKTMIYVCSGRTCKMPVEGVEEAVDQITA